MKEDAGPEPDVEFGEDVAAGADSVVEAGGVGREAGTEVGVEFGEDAVAGANSLTGVGAG